MGRKRSGDDFPLIATSAAIITTTAAACVIHGYDWQNLDSEFYWNSSPTIPLQNTHTQKKPTNLKSHSNKNVKMSEKNRLRLFKKQGNHLCFVRWKFSFRALKSDAGRQKEHDIPPKACKRCKEKTISWKDWVEKLQEAPPQLKRTLTKLRTAEDLFTWSMILTR